MVKKLALVAICLAYLCGSAMAQDAKTVIANAQKALGDPKSITYSGSAKDVSFQQCGANATAMICQGTHDPMRPITNYVRVIDLAAPASRHTGATNNIGGRRLDDGGARNVLPAGHAAAGGCLAAVGRVAGALHHAVGLPERRRREQRDREPPQVDGKNYTVLTWSPAVKAPSGKSYVINGYVNDQNLVERVETWLGENIMGDMHILATYSGWKDFGGAMAPAKIVQTRGGWPFFEVDVTAAKANPPDVATLAPAPAPAGGPRRSRRRRAGGGAAAAARHRR